MPTAHLAAYALDPGRLVLNHGSFGACLKSTLVAQAALRVELEREPTRFFEDRYPVLIEQARASVARLVDADEAGTVFVSNASAGVATVLASLERAGHFERGDALLTTDHVYPACKNMLAAVAERVGAEVVVAKVPFPLRDPSEVLDAVRAAITPRTKLALFDHVTSPTGLVFPIEALVHEVQARGIPALVDGAHAPGMVPLSLRRLGASFYTGNLHKWISAPKSSAFLWAAPRFRGELHPLVVSHGWGKGLAAEFDWTGTFDATALFSVPDAIAGLSALHPAGLEALMAESKERALRAQGVLSAALGIERPAPASMIGTLVTVPLPPRALAAGERDPDRDALDRELSARVPFFPWPAPPARCLRISIAPYVGDDDVQTLADWLRRRALR